MTIHFTSAAEAWEEYKNDYFGEEYKELADGYENDNPLKNSASYEVYFESADMQQELVTYIGKIDGVRKINSSKVTADGLVEIASLVTMVSVVILAILLAIPLIILYFAYGNLVNFILGKFSFLSTILTFMPIMELYRVLVPIALILGVGLGLLGSMISLGRHLKK